MRDMVIIGAGPAGLSCAIEAEKNGLDYLVLEKGSIVDSIYHFPENMVFFSTPENLEIGGIPFMFPGRRPNRVAALDYYRRVVGYYNLRLHLFEAADGISRENGGFHVRTKTSGGETREYRTRNIVYATGFFDCPNRLHVPGADLPKVQYRLISTHPAYGLKVAVVGAGNSAVEAALELYRGGAEVTLIHRGKELSRGVKYWVIPDIRNRIEKGEIDARFSTEVVEIEQSRLRLREGDKEFWIENDLLYPLIGYTPDPAPLESVGVDIEKDTGVPSHDPATYETNVPGFFVCGSLAAGNNANSIFIENGKLHGKPIVRKIMG